MNDQTINGTATRAQTAVGQNETDTAAILSAIPAGIIITDADTHEILEINNAALKLIGESRDTVIGQRCHQLTCPAGKASSAVTGSQPAPGKSERVSLVRNGRRISVLKTATQVSLRGRRCLLECLQETTECSCGEQELRTAQKKLAEASRLAGLAEVATDVLHNVGNVLNSVNTSTTLVSDRLKQSSVGGISRVAALLNEHAADLGGFLTSDPRGKELPGYLTRLGEYLSDEQTALLKEMDQIRKYVEHIKDIVAMQQNYARVAGVSDFLTVPALVEDALRINASALARHDINLVREFAPDLPQVIAEKHKVLHILVNLISNAKYACDDNGVPEKRITVRVERASDRVRVAVSDNGVGISAENLPRIFTHGFTTRKEGHGFGLHSGAAAAKEMGGRLSVHSDGVGRGATFTLELPLQPPKQQG